MDLQLGQRVFSGSGDAVGVVKRVAGDRFLVNRPMQRDTWFPENAIARIDDAKVILKPQTYELSEWSEHA